MINSQVHSCPGINLATVSDSNASFAGHAMTICPYVLVQQQFFS
jgi:hypothetical protein